VREDSSESSQESTDDRKQPTPDSTPLRSNPAAINAAAVKRRCSQTPPFDADGTRADYRTPRVGVSTVVACQLTFRRHETSIRRARLADLFGPRLCRLLRLASRPARRARRQSVHMCCAPERSADEHKRSTRCSAWTVDTRLRTDSRHAALHGRSTRRNPLAASHAARVGSRAARVDTRVRIDRARAEWSSRAGGHDLWRRCLRDGHIRSRAALCACRPLRLGCVARVDLSRRSWAACRRFPPVVGGVSTFPAGLSTACRRFALGHGRRVDPSCRAGCVAAHPSGQTCACVDRSGGSHAGHLPTPPTRPAPPTPPTRPAPPTPPTRSAPADAVRSR
jgi:hypothetical protein